MKHKFISTLKFLKIVDPHDSTVSLTSLALWIVLVQLACVHNPSLVDVSALLLALASYSAKKLINQKVVVAAQTDLDAVAMLSEKVESHAQKFNQEIESVKNDLGKTQMAASLRR